MPEPSPFVWCQFTLPTPVHPDVARAVLVGLASLPGQPRLVLEAFGGDGKVSWRIGCAEAVMPRAGAVFRTHVPGVRLALDASGFDRSDDLAAAGQIRLPGSRHVPLRQQAVTTVTRSLLGVFASTRRAEVLRLQVILGPRQHPRRGPQIDGVTRTVILAKHGSHGFGCCIRLAARSGSEARARQLISDAAAALRGLEVPGVQVSLGRASRRSVTDVRSPYLWPLWLSVDDLVPLLAWPISEDPQTTLPGMPPRHPRLVPATEAHPSAGRRLGIATADDGQGRPLALSVEDSLRHLHVLGPTGVGKSTLLAQLALSDVEQGRGVVVIDPKGDLVDDLLARIPAARSDDVVVLDARDEAPAGINPLVDGDPDLAADSLLAVFHSLYADSWGPRTQDILHASLLTLARRGDASLVMVPLLLTNPGFRRSVIGKQVKVDPLGLGSFWATFEAWSDAEREQAIRPLMNKLRQVMLRPSLRAVFGQRRPKFSLSDVFGRRRVFLVALGKGSIGPEAAQLLGSILVSHLWQTALGRTGVAASQRTPVMVYIDEVQDYLRLPGDLGDALAQARGLGVGFTLANQELGQLKQIRGAVMANTRSRVYFQLAPDDARDLAGSFGGDQLSREDFRALGQYQAYAQLLDRGSTTPWASLTTEALPRRVRDPAVLRRRSQERYGQSLDAVETDLVSLTNRVPSHAGQPPEGEGRTAESIGLSESLGRRRPAAKPVQADEEGRS